MCYKIGSLPQENDHFTAIDISNENDFQIGLLKLIGRVKKKKKEIWSERKDQKVM